MEEERILILGDTHADFSGIRKLNSQCCNSIFLHVGDFGVGFSRRDEEIISKLGNLLDANGNKLFTIRGNHDDASWFDDREIGPIKFLKDNQVIRIINKDVLFIGGAISIDRTARKEGADYWKDEIAIVDLEKVNEYSNVDIVISHTAPLCAPPFGLNNRNVLEWCSRDKTLKDELVKERQEFTNLKEKLQERFNIQRWVYGHFHARVSFETDGILFDCLDCVQSVFERSFTDLTELFYGK